MQGVLLPRIIASGRTWLRRSCVSLTVEGLPCQAQPPYALCSVSPCGEPTWEPCADGRPLHYLITVPLLCQVRDACGCLHSGLRGKKADFAVVVHDDLAVFIHGNAAVHGAAQAHACDALGIDLQEQFADAVIHLEISDRVRT